MAKRWPALDVGAASDLLAERVQAIADDFSPTAIEETPTGLRVFFSTSGDRDRAARALGSFQALAVDVSDEDWARRSQENLTPVGVGRIVVSPPWHVPPSSQPRASSPEPITIVIAPSMGFGTGHHATTRLCLAALQAVDLEGASVLDAGTGSGVLAMAAVHLGAARVLGIDDDADAIHAAVENLALNPALPAGRIRFEVSDLLTRPLPVSEVVVANLTGGLLIRAAARLGQAVKPGGFLLMSGLESGERDGVWETFATRGFSLVDEAEEGGWITITVRRRSKA